MKILNYIKIVLKHFFIKLKSFKNVIYTYMYVRVIRNHIDLDTKYNDSPKRKFFFLKRQKYIIKKNILI